MPLRNNNNNNDNKYFHKKHSKKLTLHNTIEFVLRWPSSVLLKYDLFVPVRLCWRKLMFPLRPFTIWRELLD